MPAFSSIVLTTAVVTIRSRRITNTAEHHSSPIGARHIESYDLQICTDSPLQSASKTCCLEIATRTSDGRVSSDALV
ncbi:hypothetical protein EV356DRAFT_506484 [Viridothelium virens]|uniref:Uncharacterized protein n=1 Tax=Viridothelium virens TaxID=1048519 RepID=A0A6A6H2R6_VIRVR|nr:hypothetical protein EV356DRAFT_506484 [Viridothelium virens]